MRDARGIRNDQRHSGPRFGLGESLHSLNVVGPDCNLSDIDVAIAARLGAEIFLGSGLASRSKLRYSCSRRGFRSLATGVGIHLGIKHEDVDIAPGPEHVIETSGTDVVCPTIAANNPHVLTNERSTERTQPPGKQRDSGIVALNEGIEFHVEFTDK